MENLKQEFEEKYYLGNDSLTEEVFNWFLSRTISKAELLEYIKNLKTDTNDVDLMMLEGKRMNEDSIRELVKGACNLRQNTLLDDLSQFINNK